MPLLSRSCRLREPVSPASPRAHGGRANAPAARTRCRGDSGHADKRRAVRGSGWSLQGRGRGARAGAGVGELKRGLIRAQDRCADSLRLGAGREGTGTEGRQRIPLRPPPPRARPGPQARACLPDLAGPRVFRPEIGARPGAKEPLTLRTMRERAGVALSIQLLWFLGLLWLPELPESAEDWG